VIGHGARVDDGGVRAKKAEHHEPGRRKHPADVGARPAVRVAGGSNGEPPSALPRGPLRTPGARTTPLPREKNDET